MDIPHNMKSLMHNAEKALGQGCTARGILLCKTLLAQYPEDPASLDFIENITCDINDLSDENRCFDLGNLMAKVGRLKAATACYRRAIEINPAPGKFYIHLATMLNAQDKIDEAIFYFKVALEMNPDSMAAKHMLAALEGRTTSKPPGHYVRNLFDRISPCFDRHMQVKLGYRVPGLMVALLDSVLPPGRRFDHGLDLGCGTGLAGEKFRHFCKRISGIDVSSKMIALAMKKTIYDHLHESEITVFLNQTRTVYDLFIAGDVLVYLGDLAPLFQGVARCSASNCAFVFSDELIHEPGYRLLKTGRYGHSKQYVVETARGCGFELSGYRQAEIRLEKGRWIQGGIYCFSSRECGFRVDGQHGGLQYSRE